MENASALTPTRNTADGTPDDSIIERMLENAGSNLASWCAEALCFNRSKLPSCAFSYNVNCLISPKQNRQGIEILGHGRCDQRDQNPTRRKTLRGHHSRTGRDGEHAAGRLAAGGKRLAVVAGVDQRGMLVLGGPARLPRLHGQAPGRHHTGQRMRRTVCPVRWIAQSFLRAIHLTGLTCGYGRFCAEGRR